MKKIKNIKAMIKAVQVAPESQQSPMQLDYLELNNSDNDNIVIIGNNDYIPFTTRFNECLYNSIDTIASDAPAARELFGSIDNMINYYSLEKNNGRRYSNKEKHDLITALTEYYNGSIDIEECYCVLLSLIYSARFDYKHIYGSVQREYNTIYYNADIYSANDLYCFESDYFNTGSEYIISGCSIYCYGYKDEMIKKELSAATGINTDNIILDSYF